MPNIIKIALLSALFTAAALSPSFAEKVAPETKVYSSNGYGDSSYHNEYCTIVTRGFGKNTMALQAAIDKKKTPCKICNPAAGLTHRKAKPKKTISASLNPKKNYRTGDSAADFERDPDGTVIGRGGGGLSIYKNTIHNPEKNKKTAVSSTINSYRNTTRATSTPPRRSSGGTISTIRETKYRANITYYKPLPEGKNKVSVTIKLLDLFGKSTILRKKNICAVSISEETVCARGAQSWRLERGESVRLTYTFDRTVNIITKVVVRD